MTLWHGIEGIYYKYNGCWNDPQIIYKDHVFTAEYIEDALWDKFCEDTGHDINEQVNTEFDAYLKVYAKDYLDDCIFGNCFT